MSTRATALLSSLAAVVVTALALAAPTDVEARTCESMGPKWFNSNQGTECDNSCSEACIVKWDCDGEACEPHHCWKCAADSPPPPPPPPPNPDPVRDAGGVRCDAMGEGWFFSNQGNACNESCSEACIPKWDCGGQPCRPHHCWKCAAGTAPAPPAPPDPGPGGPGRRRFPNALLDTNYHYDEENVYVSFHVEALHSLENVQAEFSVEREGGAVLASGSAADTHTVDVTLAVPLSQVVQPEVNTLGIPNPVDIIKGAIRIGNQVYHFVVRFVKVKQSKVEACWPFEKWENNTCHYKAPSTKCGEAKCIKDAVTITGKTSADQCSPHAQVTGTELVFDISILGKVCTKSTVNGAAACDVCKTPEKAVPKP